MAIALSSSLFSADIYLDKDKTLYAQTILCGNFSNMATVKAAYLYTSTQDVEVGTYHYDRTASYNNAYGKKVVAKHSTYTVAFERIANEPKQIMKRTFKENKLVMTDTCIVGKIDKLPPVINDKIKREALEVNSSSRKRRLDMSATFMGRPVFK